MNEEYNMEAFDKMIIHMKAGALKSEYPRNVHDALLHGWIEGVKHERRIKPKEPDTETIEIDRLNIELGNALREIEDLKLPSKEQDDEVMKLFNRLLIWFDMPQQGSPVNIIEDINKWMGSKGVSDGT